VTAWVQVFVLIIQALLEWWKESRAKAHGSDAAVRQHQEKRLEVYDAIRAHDSGRLGRLASRKRAQLAYALGDLPDDGVTDETNH
jgi:hypothetical protein